MCIERFFLKLKEVAAVESDTSIDSTIAGQAPFERLKLKLIFLKKTEHSDFGELYTNDIVTL